MSEPVPNFGFKEFLSASLSRCMDAAKARSGSIFLLDKQKNELVLEVASNIRGVNLDGLTRKVGEGIVGRVAFSRTPLLVKDIDELPIFEKKANFYNYQTKSFLSVPLEHYGDLLGVVNITDRAYGHCFDNEDMLAILSVCDHLGIAMYSIMKYIYRQKSIYEALHQEIRNLKKSIEHSKKFSSLGKLAGGFVHELNNPLDGIIRYVNLALDYSDSEGVVKEYLLEAKQGLDRVVKIVRSLLDFSWNLSKTATFIDVNRAIEECLFLANDSLLIYDIKIRKQFSPQLPLIPDYRLKLVVTNLIKNACSAMKETGGFLSVSTALIADKIEIIIADTGSGIPEHIQKKIFEPFFTTKNIGEGSGLGLAICQEAVQRYNGTINFESKLNQGSKFIIRLPANYNGSHSQKQP